MTEVERRELAVTIATRQGQRIRLPRSYLLAGHLQLGYCLTAHKAQGLTVDQAHVVANGDLDREWGYVALSRGRDANHLYLSSIHQDEAIDIAPPGEPEGDPIEVAALRVSRSRGKTLALDDLS